MGDAAGRRWSGGVTRRVHHLSVAGCSPRGQTALPLRGRYWSPTRRGQIRASAPDGVGAWLGVSWLWVCHGWAWVGCVMAGRPCASAHVHGQLLLLLGSPLSWQIKTISLIANSPCVLCFGKRNLIRSERYSSRAKLMRKNSRST
jgi:hypothetical protein